MSLQIAVMITVGEINMKIIQTSRSAHQQMALQKITEYYEYNVVML